MELNAALRRRPHARLALNVYVGAVFVFLMLPLFIVFPISFSNDPFLAFPPQSWGVKYYLALPFRMLRNASRRLRQPVKDWLRDRRRSSR